jgi:Uma2 family endonuclease
LTPGETYAQGVRTLLPNPPPPEFGVLLEERRRLGNDRFDEVWDGVLHVNPAPQLRHGALVMRLAVVLEPLARRAGLVLSDPFNLGTPADYRIPDAGLVRDGRNRLFIDTAALAVEVLSPNDETWAKLPFYAAHEVDEVLIVDPDTRAVHWLARAGDGYEPIERSGLIELGSAELAARIEWPN